jgi:hypothetical protein
MSKKYGVCGSRDAGVKTASRWVSVVSAKVSVEVSSARILLFLNCQELENLLLNSVRPQAHKIPLPHGTCFCRNSIEIHNISFLNSLVCGMPRFR